MLKFGIIIVASSKQCPGKHPFYSRKPNSCQALHRFMKKHLRLPAVLIALLFSARISAQGWGWSRGVGCNNLTTTQSEGYIVKTDHSDNIYAAGYNADDTMCLGPYIFSNPELLGYYNSFQTIIAKYDATGNLLWADAGLNGQSVPIAISVDAGNNLYVFGYFYSNTVKFGTQVLTKTDTFSHHFFIVKYNASGTALWTKDWGGTPGSTLNTFVSGGMVIDEGGNIIAGGTFSNNTLTIGSLSV
jgi:hypothetical protein